MNFKLFIAKRYLFSKSTQNVINIISGISMTGVAVGTAALIVVLSVFNGFDGLIQQLFNAFDPDLKITVKEGKTFVLDDETLKELRLYENIVSFTEVVEENVLLKYGEKLQPATIKGVSENYNTTTGIDTMLVQGSYVLENNGINYAVVGQGIAYYLSVGLNFINPIMVYVPKNTGNKMVNAQNAFNVKNLFPSGIFAVQQEFDIKYIITNLTFVREILNYHNELSSIEIKLKKNTDISSAKKQIASILGNGFLIRDRYEQHSLFFKIMKSEKWAIFLILAFILVIASFNIIASIAMLIMDKKNDVSTLNSMGADANQIQRIFIYEGWLISFIGTIIGLIFGALICYLQITYGLVKLEGTGSFIIDAYPVAFKATDFIYVLFLVIVVGFVAAWFPSKVLIQKILKS